MKAVTFFLGADLRSGHIGLQKLARTKGMTLSSLNNGEAVVFINTARNKLKCYSWNGVLSYVRFDDPKRGIDMGSLNEIPRAFRPDGTMDYTGALRKALIKRLRTPGRFEELEVL